MENNNIIVLCGDIASAQKAAALRPFDPDAIEFLATISDILMKDKTVRAFPDIVTFAFFCRHKNLIAMSQKYDTASRVGQGLCFHIAPSNVPINFAYSLVAALLAGNASIVKISSKDFDQTAIIVAAIEAATAQTGFPAEYATIVQYPSANAEATATLSAMCDVRMIWGGDDTIAAVRKAEIAPRAFDITFADRYSVAVVDAEFIEQMDDLSKLAEGFYNDTYLYDQNACTSPRLVYWIGDETAVAAAKTKFWAAVYDQVVARYSLETVVAVDKYTNACRAAIELDDASIVVADNYITRLEVASLTADVAKFYTAGGSFVEYVATDIEDLLSIADKKYQTIAYAGTAAIADAVVASGIRGIDRVVDIGKTTDFNLIWDGANLILRLSRIVFS